MSKEGSAWTFTEQECAGCGELKWCDTLRKLCYNCRQKKSEEHMEKLWKCSEDGVEVIPVEGVTAYFINEYWWCARHAPLRYENGKAVLTEFPAKGKLIPNTILHE